MYNLSTSCLSIIIRLIWLRHLRDIISTLQVWKYVVTVHLYVIILLIMSQVTLFECLRWKRRRVESADDEATSSSLPITCHPVIWTLVQNHQRRYVALSVVVLILFMLLMMKLVLVALFGLKMKFHLH